MTYLDVCTKHTHFVLTVYIGSIKRPLTVEDSKGFQTDTPIPQYDTREIINIHEKFVVIAVNPKYSSAIRTLSAGSRLEGSVSLLGNND